MQHYFRTVLCEGAPLVAAVDIEHTGTFNLADSGAQWKPFRSSQRVTTCRPGFVWDGQVAMLPGLAVHVHDAYVAGEGILHPALLGLFSLMGLRGTGELPSGELMRYLAEAAWYPTALLPSHGVRWDAVDAQSARASLTDGDLTVALLVQFDAEGLIQSVYAEGRGRMVAGHTVPTPWEGRWSDYEWRGGMRVPTRGEVAWLLPEGRHPYWRGAVIDLRYEFAATPPDKAG